jgi:quercetin dioxygenase-like cupin family protein
MEINADFSTRVAIRTGTLAWTPSPMAGVERRMLDRIGGEVARATSIVRYASGSHFSPHVHDGGEEFIVLEGVFQDEHGDYPAGTYIRNPPTTRHTPGSAPGCVIFVKLWQFDPEDRHQMSVDMNRLALMPDPERHGVSSTTLFEDACETVRVEQWDADARISFDVPGGAELLLLDGCLSEGGDTLSRHDWLRVPVGGKIDAHVGREGARLWIKTGHLRDIRVRTY